MKLEICPCDFQNSSLVRDSSGFPPALLNALQRTTKQMWRPLCERLAVERCEPHRVVVLSAQAVEACRHDAVVMEQDGACLLQNREVFAEIHNPFSVHRHEKAKKELWKLKKLRP